MNIVVNQVNMIKKEIKSYRGKRHRNILIAKDSKREGYFYGQSVKQKA